MGWHLVEGDPVVMGSEEIMFELTENYCKTYGHLDVSWPSRKIVGVDWGQGVEKRYAKKDYVGASPLPKVDLEEARRKHRSSHWIENQNRVRSDNGNPCGEIVLGETHTSTINSLGEPGICEVNKTEEKSNCDNSSEVSSGCPNCVGRYVCWDCRL